MAGRGRAPKPQSRTAHKPQRGQWKPPQGIGWQHGRIPRAPDGLMSATRATWQTWFRSWWAAHWMPENLPEIRTAIRLYDQVQRGQFQRANELRQWLDDLGITLKGQQDRRWSPPEGQPEVVPDKPKPSRYAHLKAVPGA